MWLWLLVGVALAQDESDQAIPVPQGEVEEPRRFINKEGLEEYNQLKWMAEQQVRKDLDAKAAEIERLQAEMRTMMDAQNSGVATASPESSIVGTPESANQRAENGALERSSGGASGGAQTGAVEVGTVVGPSRGAVPAVVASPWNAVQVFGSRTAPGQASEVRTVLPAHTQLRFTALTGVEAPQGLTLPMTVEIDWVGRGPNGTKVDLRGCTIEAKMEADLSVLRVFGEAYQLSCVRRDGEAVVVPIKGYVTGADNIVGMQGVMITRQGKAMLAATLSSVVGSAGDALAQAQQNQQVVTSPLGGTGVTAQNVDGSVPLYVAGSAGASAAGRVTDWYLRQAEALKPAIGIGAGAYGWVVLLEEVEFDDLGGR